jgi:hypothetical protein
MRDNYRTHLAHHGGTVPIATGQTHSKMRTMLHAARARATARTGCDAWGRNVSTSGDTASALTGPVTVPEAALGVGATLGLLGAILGAPLWGALLLGAGAAAGTKVAIDKVTGA